MALVVLLLAFITTLIINISLFQFVYATGQTSNMTKTGEPSSSHNYNHNNIISTRGHFDHLLTGELIPEHNLTDYLYYNNNNKESRGESIQTEIICAPEKEIVIYIHGAWIDQRSANEQANRTDMSLSANNYTVPLIGFSWDSNTPFSEEGWKNAKIIAANNGPKLAQFILDFKNRCEESEIRLIAHSLGAAVVNSALISLSNNQELDTDSDFNITSIHLLGAAINRSEIAGNTTLGKAIEKLVDNFYNLRNPEDNMLEYIYRYVEDDDDALGRLGIQHSLPLPRDYIEQQVDSEIPPIPDADGNSRLDCFDFFVLLPGDNHCGYIGFRGLPPFENIPRSDGSMDVVVQDWLG
jgi:hypothetical protein